MDGARAEATDVRHKRRRDHTITDRPLLRRLTQHVGARVFPELRKAFAFEAAGFEGFKIGCYTAEDQGFFTAHRDNLSAGTAHRRFGLSLNLNEDYDGGELRFPEYGGARYRPAAGRGANPSTSRSGGIVRAAASSTPVIARAAHSQRFRVAPRNPEPWSVRTLNIART